MSLTSLSSSQLHRLIELVQQKEGILVKLAKVNRELYELEGKPVTKEKPLPSAGRSGRRRRRGALKTSLLKILETAGTNGSTVKELAASLNLKPANVHAWFYTTGKKVEGIRKVGKARFAYTP